MKKTVLVCLLAVISVFALSACNSNTSTVDQSWASEETLSYSMYDSAVGSGKVGDVTMSTTTKLSDEDKAVATSADTKVVVDVTKTGVCTLSTTYYSKVYRVLTLKRTYTDLADSANNYVLDATHDGKYYKYTLTYPNASDKNKSGKINVGTSGYTDNEFLYFYVRCYNISSVPSSIKIADPFTDTCYTVGCSYSADAATITTETDELGAVICNSVVIKKTSSPVGSGITVYYLPEKDEYTYGTHTVIKSVKLPTRIEENTVSYVLNGFSATK